ncbi:MAG: winged helix-turn-helix domain-containing protein [Myxococcales bacterium]|nr:winged helix-turn-helix domain-containing protein [Myxococcales bacterium]
MSIDPSTPPWTFLSNHGHILLCVARDPNIRVREIAQAVGITERAVQRILGELEAAGVISRSRNGRRTHYEIDEELPLRHPVEADHTIEELLSLAGSKAS